MYSTGNVCYIRYIKEAVFWFLQIVPQQATYNIWCCSELVQIKIMNGFLSSPVRKSVVEISSFSWHDVLRFVSAVTLLFVCHAKGQVYWYLGYFCLVDAMFVALTEPTLDLQYDKKVQLHDCSSHSTCIRSRPTCIKNVIKYDF